MEVLRRSPPPDDLPSRVVTVGAGVLAAVSGVVFAGSLLAGAPLEVYGTALAVGAFALAFALRRAAISTYPYVEATEERHRRRPLGEPIAAVQPVARRTLLRRSLWLGASAFVLSLLAPLAALGPGSASRGRSPDLRRTGWAAGVRLTDVAGVPLRPDDVPAGGFVTVVPEGSATSDRSVAILVGLTTDPASPIEPAWVVDGRLVAYSKLCTHMGCPVGMLRTGEDALYCPCHQASFDGARGAVPVFGPAARPLPQLPLGVGEDGFLMALGDFPEDVGAQVGRERPS